MRSDARQGLYVRLCSDKLETSVLFLGVSTTYTHTHTNLNRNALKMQYMKYSSNVTAVQTNCHHCNYIHFKTLIQFFLLCVKRTVDKVTIMRHKCVKLRLISKLKSQKEDRKNTSLV